MSEGAITQLIAGVPITDPPGRGRGPLGRRRARHAVHRAELRAGAGSGRITFAVTDLDALLERLVAAGIEHEQIETCSNGVRHVRVPDPDGNAIAFAEPPEQLVGG